MQFVRRDPREYVVYSDHDVLKPFDKFLTRDRVATTELSVPVSRDTFSADTAHDPLRDVPAKMQDQIPDGVLDRVLT